MAQEGGRVGVLLQFFYLMPVQGVRVLETSLLEASTTVKREAEKA